MKTVEEITAEVAKETPADMHEEEWIIWFATRFLARVDQERGKEASLAYEMVDRFLRNNLDDAEYAEMSGALDLVFLSPMIPEGMALVKVFDLEDALESLEAGDAQSTRNILDRLIQAAGVAK